jgi:hypothetical protein
MSSALVIPHFEEIYYVMFYSILLHYTAYALRVKHRCDGTFGKRTSSYARDWC